MPRAVRSETTNVVRARVEWGPAPLEHLRVHRTLNRTFEEVEPELRARPQQVVRLAYGMASDTGPTTISLSTSRGSRWLQVPVQVECFTSPAARHGSIVSITWWARHLQAAFPTMEADLSVYARDNGQSELVLDCTYRPPLGVLGLLIDRLVGRWAATTATRTFVDRLAAQLESS